MKALLFVCLATLSLQTLPAQTPGTKLFASDGQVSDRFGGTVEIQGDVAFIGARLDDDNGTDAGAVYVMTRDVSGWTESQKLLAGDPQAEARFGRSLSVDGDYLIIGAHMADLETGAAYVFLRNGNVWEEQAKLTSSDPDSGDAFGLTVGISGDYAIIGALGDDQAGNDAGAAYVFHRTGTTWTQVTKLIASDAAADDRFGRSVAISGDYAVIGAPGDDDRGGASGSVYVFHFDGANWTELTKLHASDGITSDNFGFAVDIKGSNAIVGANFAQTPRTGAAYIYHVDNMVWSEVVKLISADADSGDEFGTSVAINDQLAVVGASWKADSTGAAYVYQPAGSTWVQYEKLSPADLMIGDEFGRDVAVSGFNVLVGAINGDGLVTNSGTAYVYENVTVDVGPSGSGTMPVSMKLFQNYPNPFNPSTLVTYALPSGGDVELTVYTLLGQPVKTLVREYQSAGIHQVVWDGTSENGSAVAAGLYLYSLKAGGLMQTKKMTLLK